MMPDIFLDLDVDTIPLHETVQIRENMHVTKVPGGWIYSIFMYTTNDQMHERENMQSVFVPSIH